MCCADELCSKVRQSHRYNGLPDDFQREQCRNALRECLQILGDGLAMSGSSLPEITRQPPDLRNKQNDGDSGTDSDDDQHS